VAWLHKLVRLLTAQCTLIILLTPAGLTAQALPEQQLPLVLLHGPWPAPIQHDPSNHYAGNPQAIALGRMLFSDPALSGNGKIACSSCHIPALGFAEPRAVAVGMAEHHRNSQGLLNADQQRWFGWDGGADSLWAATLRPLLSPIEMNSSLTRIATTVSSAVKRSGFQIRPSLPPPDEPEKLAVAGARLIAAYIETLRSPATTFDHLRNELSRQSGSTGAVEKPADYPADAWRGLILFTGEARCHLCHYGPNFSNGEFHDIGRPFLPRPGVVDPGRYRGIQRVRQDRYNRQGPFARQPGDTGTAVARVSLGQVNWGQWRTPSLRNLTLTAPYMHDGSLRTLRDVVDWYADIDVTRLHANGETILRPLGLTDAQRNDLVAFLETLSTSGTGPSSTPTGQHKADAGQIRRGTPSQ
jgi:cytochrome c peroxidase